MTSAKSDLNYCSGCSFITASFSAFKDNFSFLYRRTRLQNHPGLIYLFPNRAFRVIWWIFLYFFLQHISQNTRICPVFTYRAALPWSFLRYSGEAMDSFSAFTCDPSECRTESLPRSKPFLKALHRPAAAPPRQTLNHTNYSTPGPIRVFAVERRTHKRISKRWKWEETPPKTPPSASGCFRLVPPEADRSDQTPKEAWGGSRLFSDGCGTFSYFFF